MDFINEKLTSITAPAISKVNDYRKRKQEERQKQFRESKSMGTESSFSRRDLDPMMQSVINNPSVPFGGDSSSQRTPPPIGFRTDLFAVAQQSNLNINSNQNNNQQVPKQETQQMPDRTQSDTSLYQTDTWSRLWFQRIMLISLIRLLLFVRKVYEDFHATKTYNGLPGQFAHFLIAAATLFLPTIVFTIYRVARYLQIILPQRRAILTKQSTLKTNVVSTSNLSKKQKEEPNELRQALMASSPTPTPATPDQKVVITTATATTTTTTTNSEDDGLVTARQTPTTLAGDLEFQDSQSQLDLQASAQPTNSDPPIRPARSKSETRIESVQVDKLGDIPDKESVKVVLGTSEQILHGVLYVFWQLKRQVDVMGYLVERACLWRKPSEQEKEELERLRTGSDGLEWFQDFYAAFLAIMVQVYTLGRFWTGDSIKYSNSRTSGGALNAIATFDTPDLAISSSAKALSETLRQQTIIGAAPDKDLLIMSELVVSSAVVFSLLIAVRRKDDGPLTLLLSMLGWGSIFASRIIIIALSFVIIKWTIMLPLIGCHIIGITSWIYKISLDSFNDMPSERGDQLKWDPVSQDVELTETKRQDDSPTKLNSSNNSGSNATKLWSPLEHLTLITQIFTLFAVPSLFYWPIMFNLKTHQRPLKYLVLIMSENFLLITAIWLNMGTNDSSQPTSGQLYLLGAVGSFSIVGFIFVGLYMLCKPSLTEYFARADEIFNQAERAGIYFEFCSRIFKMPDLSKATFQRLMNQTEVVEEEEVQVTNNKMEEIQLDD